MYLNVAPFLLNLAECYTTLIFYDAIDFTSPVYPISIFRVGLPYKRDDCSCNFTAEEKVKFKSFWVISRLCPSVLANFHTKGTRCVGVMSVFPEYGVGQHEIYWLLDYYWCRVKLQYCEDEYNGSFTAVGQHMKLPIFFPISIKIQTLVSEKHFNSGNIAKHGYKEYKDNLPFTQLPIVVISIPAELELESINYVGKIGFVFNGYDPVSLTDIDFTSSPLRFNEAHLNEEINEYRKNKLICLTYDYALHWDNIHISIFNKFSEVLLEAIGRNRSSNLVILSRGWGKGYYSVGVDGSLSMARASNYHFIFLSQSNPSLVTCSGYRESTTFVQLVTPFDFYSWICLFLLILCTSLPFLILCKYRELATQFPFILVFLLLENSYTIKEKLNGPPVRVLIGVFLLMGIVLSNGYKSFVNTSTVTPFEGQRIKSLASALLERDYKLKPERTVKQKEDKECGEGFNEYSKNYVINRIKLDGKTENYVDELSGYDNLDLMIPAPAQNESYDKKLLYKLMRNTETAECGFDTLAEEIMACKEKIALVMSDGPDAAIFAKMTQFNLNQDFGNQIYTIEETHGLLKSQTLRIQIGHLNVARKLIWQVIRGVEESALLSKWKALERRELNFNTTSMLRTVFGKSSKQDLILTRLQMKYIHYTFFVFLYISIGGIALFALEMLTKKTSHGILHCQRMYLWTKATVSISHQGTTKQINLFLLSIHFFFHLSSG